MYIKGVYRAGREIFYMAFSHSLGDKPCLGSRLPSEDSYSWKTYEEVDTLAQRVGSALIHLGHSPRSLDKIGVYGTNRWEVSQYALIH